MTAPLLDAAKCRKCGRHPQARGTGWCARCLDAEDVRRETLPRRPRIAGAGPAAARVCEWCGGVIAGHANRRTCSPTHRKALSRAGGNGPFSPPDVTPLG